MFERAVAQTVLERGRLDIVFANAGFGGAGLFSTLTLDHPGSGQTHGSPADAGTGRGPV